MDGADIDLWRLHPDDGRFARHLQHVGSDCNVSVQWSEDRAGGDLRVDHVAEGAWHGIRLERHGPADGLVAPTNGTPVVSREPRAAPDPTPQLTKT